VLLLDISPLFGLDSSPFFPSLKSAWATWEDSGKLVNLVELFLVLPKTFSYSVTGNFSKDFKSWTHLWAIIKLPPSPTYPLGTTATSKSLSGTGFPVPSIKSDRSLLGP